MYREAALPVAPQTAAPARPRRRVEIHVFVDRRAAVLRVEPRGVLERAAVREIIATIGFPLRGGAAEVVLAVVAICERHGWVIARTWVDEAKDLHATMAKEIEDG